MEAVHGFGFNPPSSKRGVLSPRARGDKRPGLRVVFENLERLLSPPRMILLPEDGGVASLREPPRLVLRLSEGPPPGDLESGFSGYWLVSERLHDVMVSVDPHAFTFAEADYRLEDGSRGDRHFLCTVVQVVDALDEGVSKLFIDTTEEFINGKFYDLGGGASVTFDREAGAGPRLQDSVLRLCVL